MKRCILILAIVFGSVHAAEVDRNTLGMAFVRLPAGEFLMGSDEAPESLARAFPQLPKTRFAQLDDEGPVHRVRITRPFWMGQHEVTVGQFRRFIEASGYVPESVSDRTGGYGWRADYDPATTKRGDAFEGRDPRYSWRNPGFVQGDDHPVVNVTWNDAMALAAWLSKTEGRRYRLPTEAEWEYACRAGTRSRYSSGDEPRSLLGVANVFDANSARHWPRWQQMAVDGDDGYAFTAPVGSFAPNRWGLYDMHGNAWEWVADWHGDKYYAQSPVDDPQGPTEGEVRVRRGGSWHTWAFYARAAYRNWNAPDTRYTLVGIRLVRED
ncbi:MULTISPECIES: formylglycine-generating enzyme family protein [Variovorax]|uniref:formylglycine-generating enzyme family protein n=1 Tax=Variovorax TaxID=34072 RepID=UPI00285EDE16|nr:formylglycine-generating enzyme family protein [Variovorax sp. 3319]MDR6886023.1 formylglycine-generating enzyme required for sulfatase activity [Variovorax sp. 3319]